MIKHLLPALKLRQAKPGRRERRLSAWLVHYNTEQPHLGYRNQARRPIETIKLFVSPEAYEDRS